MKLVVNVPNGFGRVVNDVPDQDLCKPITICVGSYIYRTHAYALFDDKAKVLLSDVDWLQQPGSIEKKPEPYEETIPPERMTPSENRAYWGIYG